MEGTIAKVTTYDFAVMRPAQWFQPYNRPYECISRPHLVINGDSDNPVYFELEEQTTENALIAASRQGWRIVHVGNESGILQKIWLQREAAE